MFRGCDFLHFYCLFDSSLGGAFSILVSFLLDLFVLFLMVCFFKRDFFHAAVVFLLSDFFY